jgi:hypothetical protein
MEAKREELTLQLGRRMKQELTQKTLVPSVGYEPAQ